MANGGQSSFDIRHRVAVTAWWPVDHHNRYVERTRGLDLAIGCLATGVFRHDHVDAVVVEHRDFIVERKGPARGDVSRLWHRKRRFDRIDAAYKISVLRSGLKRQKLLPTKCEKSVFRLGAERSDSSLDIYNSLPIVAMHGHPCRARQRYQRHPGTLRSLNSIGGNSCRIGMGCVHQQVETFRTKEIGKPLCPTETANTDGNGLLDRIFRAASHGQQNPVAGITGKTTGQNAGIRRAAENENGACHGF